MSDRLSRIETRLCELDRAVEDISRRVWTLEHAATRPSGVEGLAADRPAGAGPPRIAAPATSVTGLIPQTGRLLLIVGGAYFLRALTETGHLPVGRGVAFGLLYALAWLAVADRFGATRALSSAFHGAAAVLIATALLYEASTKFQLLSAETSSAAVCSITLLAFGVAAHRRLQSLAAIATAAVLPVSAMLMAATSRPLPFAVTLLALGLAAVWLADAREWRWAPWPFGVASILLVVGLTSRAAAAPPRDIPAAVMAFQLLTAGGYGTALAIGPLGYGRRIRLFDVVQVIAILTAIAGALFLSAASSAGTHAILAGVAAAGAAAAYGAAFLLIGRTKDRVIDLELFSWTGLALAVMSARALAPDGILPIVLLGIALAATFAAWRLREPSLALQGAVCAGLGASRSLSFAVNMWTWAPDWSADISPHLAVIALSAACLIVPASWALNGRSSQTAISRLARVAVSTLLVVTLGGVCLRVLGPLLSGNPMDGGRLASVRTGLLAVAAMLVAGVSRLRQFESFRVLTYPLLAIGAVKLVVDDFPHSGAAMLFVSLAAYGAALMFAPKLRGPAA